MPVLDDVLPGAAAAPVPSAVAAAPLPAALRVAYGIGGACESARALALGVFLLFFYSTVLGLPGVLVGVATALGLLWDAVIDPWIGHASDRTPGRYGRRHPWMAVGALAMGPCLLAVFMPPADLPAPALFGWLLATSLMLRTAASLFAVPFFAYGAEVTRSYDERTAMTAARAAGALAGALLTTGLAFSWFARVEGQPDPRFASPRYAAMAATVGAVMMICGLITVAGTWRRRDPAVDSAAGDASPIRHALRHCLRDRDFLALLLSSSLFFLATLMTVALSTHYLTFYAGLRDGASMAWHHGAFYTGALAGTVLWRRVAVRVDKDRLYVWGSVLTALHLLAAWALVGEGHPLGTGNLTAIIAGSASAGMAASVLWVVPPSMVADVAELDALRTGVRRDGLFFGVFSFGHQVATGLATVVVGLLLDAYAGVAAGQAAQSPEAIARVGILYGIVPAIVILAGVWPMRAYRLSRARVAALQSSPGKEI